MSVRNHGLVLGLGLCLFMLGCSKSTTPLPTQQLIVTTSISPLADLIRQVGGDKVNVVNLVPAGNDPHEYEPKPADVRQVAKSSVFFANGVGEELYLNKLVQNAGNSKLRTVVLADGLTILGRGPNTVGNPHLWLDVQNAEKYIEKIRLTLDELSPNNKTYFDQNAQAYLNQLQQLDTWIETQITTIPAENRQMLVFHDAWPYFAKRYGIRLLRPVVQNGEAEPSAKDYAQILELIKQNHVRAIFGEVGFNPKLVQQLATDSGVNYIGNLHDDTLGITADSNSYLAIMKTNTNAIVAALR